MSSTQTPTKYAPFAEPILTAAQLTERMAAIQDVAIVLSPLTGASDIPKSWSVSERYIFAQWEMWEYKGKQLPRGDVYRPSWAQGDHVAPTSQLLNRIWSAAGGSILYLRRVDDRKDPLICEAEGQLQLRQISGNLQTIPADKRLDLTAGSETAKAMSAGQLTQARQRIHELAMTEAFSRGIRKGLAMAQSYSMAALESKPFVVYACVPNFDMSDKMTRAMVVASQLGCVEALFGAAGGGRQLLIEGGQQPETIDTPNGTTVSAATGEVIDEPESGDFPDFHDEPPPPEPAIVVCGCECGDQVELDPEAEAASVKNLGGPRCAQCYPGPAFDYGRHAQMKRMGYPKLPHYTPADAHERAKKARGGAR